MPTEEQLDLKSNGCQFESDLRYHATVAQPGRGAGLKNQMLWVRLPPVVQG